MSFQQTASLVETRPTTTGDWERSRGESCERRFSLLRSFFDAVFRLEHILDVSFEQQQVWTVLAINLQCATIIPLDRSFNFFAVKQNDHHQCVRINLLFVVEEFRISFHRRRRALAHRSLILLRARILSTRISATLAIATTTMRTIVRTLSGLRHFANLALHFGKRRSDQFTITHWLTSKN